MRRCSPRRRGVGVSGDFTGDRTINTSSIGGFALLRAVAGLRRWRRGTLRYREEDARIGDWLSQIAALAGRDYDLAVEVAANQRLVKGYGDTHARGWRSFTRLLGRRGSARRPGRFGAGDAAAPRGRACRRARTRARPRARRARPGGGLKRGLGHHARRRDPLSRYRDDPEAVRALVREDCVHRDVYLSPEIFELEMRHLWRNTWIYVGHDSQVPNAGDYYTTEIARQPVIMLRDAEGAVRVLMNRCAHKGASLVSAREGHCEGGLLRCPYHGWTYRLDGSIRTIPIKSGYEGTALGDLERGRGRRRRCATSRSIAASCSRGCAESGPGFHEYFGDALSSIDNMVDRSPLGRLEVAGGMLRYMHDSNWKMFVENLNDTMHPMVSHESAAGTAKKLWAGHPEDEPKPMAIEQFLPFVNGYEFFDKMGVRIYDNGHSYSGVRYSIHSAVLGDRRVRAADGAGLRRRARPPDPGRSAPQHRLLPEPHDQGRDPGDPRRAPDCARSHAAREHDVPPGRCAGCRCCSGRCSIRG